MSGCRSDQMRIRSADRHRRSADPTVHFFQIRSHHAAGCAGPPGVEAHLRSDIRHSPSGQLGEPLRFLFAAARPALPAITPPPLRTEHRRSTHGAARSGPGSWRGRRSPGTRGPRGSARCRSARAAASGTRSAPGPAPSSQNTPSWRSSSVDSGSAAHGSHQLMSHAYSRNTARPSCFADLAGEHRLVEGSRTRRESFR